MGKTGWLAVLCTTVLVAACSGGTASSSAPQSSSSAAATAKQDRPVRFPDGTYTSTATRAEARAAGFTDQQIDEIYGPDGTLQITLRFLHGRWTQLADETPGVPEPGDLGTYRFDAGTLVLTSDSPGCPGCVAVMRWSFDNDRLSLRFTDPKKHPYDARMIMEHDYTRTG